MKQVLYELCHCNSGKKLKFCCKKQKNSDKSFEITYEPIAGTQEKYNISKQDFELFQETMVKLSQEESLKSVIEIFKILVEKYPNVPFFINNLASAYDMIGDEDTAHSLAHAVYEKFPDYLFGKISVAQFLLNDDQFDKIPAIFNNAFTLTDLFPERTVFHILEFRAFHIFMVRYFLHLNEVEQAKSYYQLMLTRDPDNEELIPYKAVFTSYAEFISRNLS